jgi:hypothetical protein
MRDRLLKKNISGSDLFKKCDGNNDGWINILDLKKGLEVIFMEDTKVFKDTVSIVKGAKQKFGTNDFDLINFKLFYNESVMHGVESRLSFNRIGGRGTEQYQYRPNQRNP